MSYRPHAFAVFPLCGTSSHTRGSGLPQTRRTAGRHTGPGDAARGGANDGQGRRPPRDPGAAVAARGALHGPTLPGKARLARSGVAHPCRGNRPTPGRKPAGRAPRSHSTPGRPASRAASGGARPPGGNRLYGHPGAVRPRGGWRPARHREAPAPRAADAPRGIGRRPTRTGRTFAPRAETGPTPGRRALHPAQATARPPAGKSSVRRRRSRRRTRRRRRPRCCSRRTTRRV